MLKITKVINRPAKVASSLKKLAVLIGISAVLSACGGLADVTGSNANMTISWEPMYVNGKNAETYRVLYSRPGERPKEVLTTTNEAELNLSSISGYTIFIEAYNNYRNSVFRLYDPS